MAIADAARLRAVVAANLTDRHRSPGRAVAVLADGWDGESEIEAIVDEQPVRLAVAWCASPLAVRAAMADHDAVAGTVLTIVTPCRDEALGLDVRARLAKGRVLSMDPWASLAAVCRVSVIDPALYAHRWMAEDLVALAPAGGWPLRLPGVLDADTAWNLWVRARLRAGATPSDAVDVLELLRSVPPDPLAGLGEEASAALAARWSSTELPVGVLLSLAAAGHQSDLVPLGLVARAVWEPATGDLATTQLVARVRLEPRLGKNAVDTPAALRWADGAEQLAGIDDRRRAEQLLAELDALPLAQLATGLDAGFDQQISRFAAALSAGDLGAAQSVLEALIADPVASARPRRVGTAQAALRLARWLQTPPVSAGDFATRARHYQLDSSWVDRARASLADGEADPIVADVYGAISSQTAQRRAGENEAFARELTVWSASTPLPSSSVVPVEQVLDEVVHPVATDQPVLILVFDGLSLAVAHELLEDLSTRGWLAACPSTRPQWPVGVAMLPTITDISRASLLAGRPVRGDQRAERDGITQHRALARHGTPRLFHKADLRAADGLALKPEVRATVADPGCRVVAAVVNAVDDHLDRGQQVRPDWSLHTMPVVSWLLEAAGEAGRVVLIVSDHGHVLHGSDAELRPLPGGGERWRMAPPPVGAGEVAVVGPRVLADGGVVMPWTEQLRYGGHKHGYHGGATPQEVLVPVVTLVRQLPDRWHRCPPQTPRWWTGAADNDVPVVAEPVVPPPSKPAPPGQAELFAPPSPPESPSAVWIGEVLASAPVAGARRRFPKLAVSDERISAVLAVLHAKGGSCPLPALAASIGVAPDDTRGLVAAIGRFVNYDGAAVLTLSTSGTVELNLALLAEQFGVEVP